MADWEEIKRLAADLQRAISSSSVQRLTERNCVELVQKLQSLSLLEVIYTIDGKEYLTPQELAKEIREELVVRGGRVNVVDLQQALKVDISHIETKVNEILREDNSLKLTLGQIIDQTYLQWLAESINDELQEVGHVTVGVLTKKYDLPGDFLSKVINDRLGNVIRAQRIDDLLYTEAYVSRHRATIRGSFSALTRPVAVSSMLQRLGLTEKLFHSILQDQLAAKRLAGSMSGSRLESAVYIPDIYTRSQNEWVDNFYKQNGYLEYDALLRVGISEPRSYIEGRHAGLLYLSSCCLGQQIQDHVESEMEEALSEDGWVDVMPFLPSICTLSDASLLLNLLLKKHCQMTVFCESIVVSASFLDSCRKSFDGLMRSKAEQTAKSNPGLLSPDSSSVIKNLDKGTTKDDRKEQRRKKAAAGSGKNGGGTQGRESKTKSTKKKGRGGGRRDEDSDEEVTSSGGARPSELEFLSVEELSAKLMSQLELEDCVDEFYSELAAHLYRPLNKEFTELAKSVFLQTVGSDTGSARKKSHSELADKVNGLYTNARLFYKGLKLFPEDSELLLSRHLLRSVCSDIANLLLQHVALDNMVVSSQQLTIQSRQKIIEKISDENLKGSLSKLNSLLQGKCVSDWLDQLTDTCSHLQLLLHKPDKKKDKQVIYGHRQALMEQLREETDLAMTLHLSVVLLFHLHTHCVLHAPGKCVPQIITFLRSHVGDDNHRTLTQCQDVVVENMKQASSGEEGCGDEETNPDTDVLLNQVKQLVFFSKKTSESSNAASPSSP